MSHAISLEKPARRMLVLLSILMAGGMLGAASPIGAQGSKSAGFAPLNPAFERYVQERQMFTAQTEAMGGRHLGLIPSPIDLSHIKGTQASQGAGRQAAEFPSRYDLRELGKVTPVGDQMLGGYCGSCWTFATYGSLESCLLPAESWDFSENNLKNTHGFDPGCCAGGNRLISVACLARWSGPVLEADDPYDPTSCSSQPGLVVRKHVQAADFLPNRSGPLDNDTIKQAVMSYGAVYTAMYIADPYYNPVTYAYYYTGSELNHAVCIVGWDDNYDKSNFLASPPGNGAFICKNSFGDGWGEGGYFYISYYDSALVQNVVFKGAEPTDNYDRVYQYDWLGWVGSFGLGAETAWFANTFTAAADCRLAAASWYASGLGSSYELYVYLDPTSEPTSGVLAASRSGVTASAGYQTVTLDSAVTLAAGQTFSLVVRITTPGYNHPVACEHALPGYSSAATANPGESYVSPDGVSWTDLTAYNPTANACLKAFTFDDARLLVTPDNGLTSTGPQGGPFSPAALSYSLTNTGVAPLSWTAGATQPWVDLSATSGSLGPGAGTNVTVEINSIASYMGSGSYSDAVAFTNTTNGTGSTTRPVSLTITPLDPPRHVSIPLAKRHANDAEVAVDGAVVTAVASSSWFYAESADRSAGILVMKSFHGVTAGETVDIVGYVKTNTSGEKYIQALAVSQSGTGSVEPLMLNNRAIGGADWHYEPITGMGQKGLREWRWVKVDDERIYQLVDAVGLNNIGLLVCTTGRITHIDTGYFYLDDGSKAQDNSAHAGIRVTCPNLALPAQGEYVKVIGTSSCFKIGSDMHRMVRVFNQSDIVVLE